MQENICFVREYKVSCGNEILFAREKFLRGMQYFCERMLKILGGDAILLQENVYWANAIVLRENVKFLRGMQ